MLSKWNIIIIIIIIIKEATFSFIVIGVVTVISV